MRIFLVATLSILPFSASAHETIVSGALGQELDAYLARIEANGFSGVVLVAKGDEVILAKGYGYADREARRRCTTDTAFDIGSITKQFTGAAILKLEEMGKLNTEDKIGKHFDDVPKDKRAITLHLLLTHSSGLRDVFGPDYVEMTRDGIIQTAMEGRLKFGVGERYFYSNSGYSLLAAIVELLTGASYESFLREQFFAPLGMTKTGYRLPSYSDEEVAVGYNKDAGRWGTPTEKLWAKDGPYWNLRGNGGILSTVWDMYTWHKALLDDSALTAASREKYFAPYADEGGDRSHYGYGWVNLKTPRGTTVYTHNGGNGIFFADCFRYVEERVFIMAMTNTTTGKRPHLIIS
ncbi:MAG: serine hydrolase domain-containing protein, partial [Candidatus Hydrogenedentota bacterium]